MSDLDFTKKCPTCLSIQTYRDKYGLKDAIDKNTKCKSCINKNRYFSKQTREKMSNSLIGRISWNTGLSHSVSTREKISNSLKELYQNGYIPNMSGTQLKSSIKKRANTLRGRFHTSNHNSKIRKSSIKYIEECKLSGGQLIPRYNISSIPILEQKANELDTTDLQHAENGGEFHIKELGYWVDGYSKEKNIVIEYYEKHHQRQSKRDLRRQKEITEFLKCEFIIITENTK